MLYKNVLEMIGNTPMVYLNKLKAKYDLKGNIIAKIEKNNPFGSVKDRVGMMMFIDAIAQGKIDKDTIIIEPTSGNTGIALAAICAYYGNPAIFTMPENMSVERQKLLKAYGAKVVLSNASEGMTGAIRLANELANKNPNSFIPSQFDNPSNPKAHYCFTGVEIYNDLKGEVDAVVAGIGTGGTVSGIGKYIKKQNDKCLIIGVEPFESAVITTGIKGKHQIQGIGAGFIPSNLDLDIIDEVITIKSEDAILLAKEVAREEGLFVGISSGSALKAAIDVASREEMKGKNIVIVFPDSGERYLSTFLGEE